MLKIAIFDDVVAGRGETFHIPGLAVDVYEHADEIEAVCAATRYDIVFMDYAMGADHQTGEWAVAAARTAGFSGRIVATSSDPEANERMQRAGADESLPKKALLRSFLVRLSSDHLAEEGRRAAAERAVTGDNEPGDNAPGDNAPGKNDQGGDQT